MTRRAQDHVTLTIRSRDYNGANAIRGVLADCDANAMASGQHMVRTCFCCQLGRGGVKKWFLPRDQTEIVSKSGSSAPATASDLLVTTTNRSQHKDWYL